MDDLHLSLQECSPSDLLQTLGPYLGTRIRRRPPGGLRLSVCRNRGWFLILVGDYCKDGSTWKDSLSVDGTMSVVLGEAEADKLCFDIIAHIPQEEVIELTMPLRILRSEELCVNMRNVTHLHLEDLDLSRWFVEPDTRESHIFKDLLPGLRYISITRCRLSGDDWSPLTNFLTHRAAVGNRISTLDLGYYPYMEEGVIESIRRAVDVLESCGNGWGYSDGSDDGSDYGL